MAEAAALTELAESVVAARDVQVHRGEADRARRTAERGTEVVATEQAARRARNRFYPLLALEQAAAAAAVLAVGALLVGADRVTVGTVAAVALAVPAVYGPLVDAVEWLDEVGAAGAAAVRVVGALDLRPGLAQPPAPQDAPRSAALSVRGLDFAYPGGPAVLRDVHLDVAPGERVALVGRSGAGKSTLARLLVRLDDPGAGTVLLGGVDLRALTPAELRRRVVLLPQDAPLPGPTPAAAAAAVGAGVEGLTGALRAVGAPLPLDAGLRPGSGWGPGGQALPAGVRQQVALALVLLADPDVVVLDEPTSALAADRVVVLDGGRVVEQGPPHRLLDAGGPFARLARPLVPGR